MNFETWEPAYEAILADFGYPRSADEAARDELDAIVGGRPAASASTAAGRAPVADGFDLSRLDAIEGATVAVAGGASTLVDETEEAAEADVVVAASTAADVLADAGIGVDLLTTDLDKNPETAVELTDAGTPVAVHAHGDNREAIGRVVPEMTVGNVLPTTQAAPRGVVRNFGGFTDGDRAAFLADHLGADRLVFPGWDLDDRTVDEEKRRKLAWAGRLLGWLERRRGERFALLDGRRESLDRSFVRGPG